MDLNAYLPFVSASVMLVFVFLVFRRFFAKGRKAYHLLLWGIGLTFYLLGSLSEALHAALGWNGLVFRLWYLFGAILVAAWLGQGTVELLVRRRVSGVRLSHVLLAILTVGSLYAAYKVFTAKLEPVMLADEVMAVTPEEGFDEQTVLAAAASALQGTAVEDGEVSERRLSPLAKTLLTEAESEGASLTLPSEVTVTSLPAVTAQVGDRVVALSPEGESRLRVAIDGQPAGTLILQIGREMYGHAIVSGGTRVLTPFFNIYGLLTLVGGAVYSAWIFLRKRIMPNRVLGNVLIAAGALMPGIGGLLSRFGLGGYLYLGELLGAVLMFAGFILATTRPETAGARDSAPAGVH